MTEIRYTRMMRNGEVRRGWYNVELTNGEYGRLGDVHREGAGWVARTQDSKILGAYTSRTLAAERLIKDWQVNWVRSATKKDGGS